MRQRRYFEWQFGWFHISFGLGGGFHAWVRSRGVHVFWDRGELPHRVTFDHCPEWRSSCQDEQR